MKGDVNLKQKVSSSKGILIFSLVYVIYFFLKLPKAIGFEKNQSILLTFLIYILLCIFGLWVFRDKIKENFIWVSKHKLKFIGVVLFLCSCEFLVSIVVGLVYNYLLTSLRINDTNLQNDINIMEVAKSFPPLAVISVMGIFGPIVEELFFRKILISHVFHKVPSFFAVLLSSILFALLHVHRFEVMEFINVLPHFSFGLIAATYYAKSKNILPMTFIHILMNLSGLLPLYMYK